MVGSCWWNSACLCVLWSYNKQWSNGIIIGYIYIYIIHTSPRHTDLGQLQGRRDKKPHEPSISQYDIPCIHRCVKCKHWHLHYSSIARFFFPVSFTTCIVQWLMWKILGTCLNTFLCIQLPSSFPHGSHSRATENNRNIPQSSSLANNFSTEPWTASNIYHPFSLSTENGQVEENTISCD